MEALRSSLDQVSTGKKKTAKVEEDAESAKNAAGPKVVAAKPAAAAKKRKAS